MYVVIRNLIVIKYFVGNNDTLIIYLKIKYNRILINLYDYEVDKKKYESIKILSNICLDE